MLGCTKGGARAIRAARKMGREQCGPRPSPYTCSSTFLLSPHFSRGPNALKLFRAAWFHSAHAGTLAAQAIKGNGTWESDYKYFDVPEKSKQVCSD